MHQSSKGSGAVDRVESGVDQPLLGVLSQLDRNAALIQTSLELLDLDPSDTHEFLTIQRIEHDHRVESVQELRPELLPDNSEHLILAFIERHVGVNQELRTHIGREDHDRIAEVHRATLPIGETAVIENLKQHVEDFRVSFLHFVEQNHRIGTATHGLRKLPTLFVTDVPRRGADEPGNRVFFGVLAHIDAHHGALVIEQELRKGLG